MPTLELHLCKSLEYKSSFKMFIKHIYFYAAKGVTFSLINGRHIMTIRGTSAWNVAKASSGGDCQTTTSRQPTRVSGRTSAESVQPHSSTQNTLRNTGVFTLGKSLIFARLVISAHLQLSLVHFNDQCRTFVVSFILFAGARVGFMKTTK